MSYSSIQDKVVTVRKDHPCEWCPEAVETGMQAHYRAYVWEGDFAAAYMHMDCRVAMTKAPASLVEEGWDPGMFKRGTYELRPEYA